MGKLSEVTNITNPTVPAVEAFQHAFEKRVKVPCSNL